MRDGQRIASKPVKLQRPDEGYCVQSLPKGQCPARMTDRDSNMLFADGKSVERCMPVRPAKRLSLHSDDATRSTIALKSASNRHSVMSLGLQVAFLFVLGVPVA